MDDEQIRAAAWDLASGDLERIRRADKVLEEAGGSAAAVLLETAHEWDEFQQRRWLGRYGSGSPTDLLAQTIGDSRAISVLAQNLHDPNPLFRGFAAFTLFRIDDPRVADLLAQAVYDEDPSVRVNSIYGLQNFGDERSYQLVMVAMDDSDGRVRAAAARALHRIGYPDSTQTLIQALNDPVDRVAEAAAQSLGVLRIPEAVGPLILTLQSGRKGLVSAAARALGSIGDRHAVAPLIEVLKATSRRSEWIPVAMALAKLPPNEVLGPLMSMLHGSDAPRRQVCATSLGMLGDARASDSVAELLADDDPEVVRSAAFALACMGDRRAVDPLIALLLIEPRIQRVRVGADPANCVNEDISSIIRDAARALGKLGDAGAIEPLAALLEDASIASVAASSLSQLGDNRGTQYLLSMLRSGKARDICTVYALGRSGNSSAVEPLVELLSSEATTKLTKSSILRTLACIGTEDAISAVESVMKSGGENAVKAAAALVKLGRDSAFEYLHSQLQSDNENQRSRVVSGLYLVSGPRVADLLTFALQDTSDTVRLDSIRILGDAGDESTPANLQPFLDDPNRLVRTAAYVAIRKLEIASQRPERLPDVCEWSDTSIPD